MRKPLSALLHLPLLAALCPAAMLSGCGGTAQLATASAAPVKAEVKARGGEPTKTSSGTTP